MRDSDTNSIEYQCGACNEAKEREAVKMVEHPNAKLGEFPICRDSTCSIEDVADLTSTAGAGHRVDDELN